MALTPKAGLCAALLLCACGHDISDNPALDAGATCTDPGQYDAPAGRLTSPADLPSDRCVSDSMAGFDPTGLWFMVEEEMGMFYGGGPVRFELSCERGLRVAKATIVSTVNINDRMLTNNELFFRRERSFDGGNFIVTDAYKFCAIDGERLLGYVGHCQKLGDREECWDGTLEMDPFGRIEGEAQGDGLELVSEIGGQDAGWPVAFSANVRVRDGLAYLARSTDGLRIVDVSDPSSLSEVGHLGVLEEENINDIKLVEDVDGKLYALLGSSARGLVVVDVSAPSNPVLVTSVTPSGQPAHGVHTLYTETIADKTYAYLADGGGPSITIWDVTAPETPSRVGIYTAPNNDWGMHDLYVEGGRMYLNATEGGLIVVDTQPDPSTPVQIGQYRPAGPLFSHSNWVTTVGDRRISVTGGEGWTAHFEVVDVDPASDTFMAPLGAFSLRDQVSAHNVMAVGERAYCAYYQDGVRIFDLGDPSAPQQVAYYNTWDPDTAPGGRFEGAVGIDLDIDAGLVYVADSERGLVILHDVTAE